MKNQNRHFPKCQNHENGCDGYVQSHDQKVRAAGLCAPCAKAQALDDGRPGPVAGVDAVAVTPAEHAEAAVGEQFSRIDSALARLWELAQAKAAATQDLKLGAKLSAALRDLESTYDAQRRIIDAAFAVVA